jgi:hypothetical protein
VPGYQGFSVWKSGSCFLEHLPDASVDKRSIVAP